MEVGVIGHPGEAAVKLVGVAEVLEKGVVIIHNPVLVVNRAVAMTVRAVSATHIPVVVSIL